MRHRLTWSKCQHPKAVAVHIAAVAISMLAWSESYVRAMATSASEVLTTDLVDETKPTRV